MQGVFPEGKVEVREPIAKFQDDPPLYCVDGNGELNVLRSSILHLWL